MFRKGGITAEDVPQVPKIIASKENPPKEEVVTRHESRFN